VPDYLVKPYAPEDMLRFEPQDVRLNKVPRQGSWFELPGGTPAQVKALLGPPGEPVIFVHVGDEQDRHHLKPKRR
jgi:hypothetical protein